MPVDVQPPKPPGFVGLILSKAKTTLKKFGKWAKGSIGLR